MAKEPSSPELERQAKKIEKRAVDSAKPEEMLQECQFSLFRLLNNLPSLVYRCRNDKQRTMEFVNDGCIDLTGYRPSGLIMNREVSYGDLIHPQDRDYVWEEVQAAVRDKRRFDIVYRVSTALGQYKWVLERGMEISSEDGNPTVLEGFVTDISEHKAAQGRTERLNLVLRTILDVNQLLVKEKIRGKLVQGVCDSLVKNRGYFNVWVALFDKSGGLIETAEAGLDMEFLPLLERLRKGELPHCVRNILLRPGPLTIEDPASTCTECPLSKSYAGRGGIMARLEYGGENRGVLVASIPKYFIGDREEQELFGEVSRDIAFALHQIELDEKYKETQERFKIASTYADENPFPVYRVIRDGTIVYANRGGRRFLDICGHDLGGRVPTDWLEIVRKVFAYGAMEEIETEVNDAIFSLSVVPVKGENYVNVYGLDITERKNTEKALLEAQKRYRDLVENSLVGIGIVHDGVVVYRNPEQERLWGPVSQKDPASSFEYVHENDAERVEAMLQKVMTGEMATADMEFRVCPPEIAGRGYELRWVHCRVSLTRYHGKEALLINMMDITDAKEVQGLLRIEDKMASLGRVAAGMAHEIRNPLSGINVYLDTLEQIYKKGENESKAVDILRRIQSASRKIESVIKRVMDFAKPSTPNFVWSDINVPVEDAINLASVTLRKVCVEVQKKLSTNLPKCRIDKQMIEGVVLNLLTNASEAMKDLAQKKKMRITSYVKNDRVFITVSDSGPGVKSGLEDKIFDPFYTTKNGSTGIGLSLSQRIIMDHGGFLSASKSRWGGARFVIEIPLTQDKNLL